MQPFTTHTGLVAPMDRANVDTDQIIPKQFLKRIERTGYGPFLFYDWRYFDDGKTPNPAFELNRPKVQGASILLARRNFGCGSSREHAPQSLMRWGIRAIVGESFAEIFFGNCTALGIPCVTADRPALEALAGTIAADPPLEINVDLEAHEVRYADTIVPIDIAAGARNALVSGQWDFLSQLLENADDIQSTAGRIPYVSGSFA